MEPNNPADASLATTSHADDISAAYEFGAEESEVFRSLGQTMSVVGIVLLVTGGLYLIQAAMVFAKSLAANPGMASASTLSPLLQGGVFLLLGFWTRGAGQHFTRVATTRGADIPLLMTALGELFSIYRLQKILFITVTALVVLTVVVVVVAAVMRGA